MVAWRSPKPFVKVRILDPLPLKFEKAGDKLVPDGDVAKLVDALDLGSSAARCKSSSLFSPTTQIGIS